MNKKTKQILIIITFISILILVIMYFIILKINKISECNLIYQLCSQQNLTKPMLDLCDTLISGCIQ